MTEQRNQWSESLKESTRQYFEQWGFGAVKHIDNKDDGYAFERTCMLPFDNKYGVPDDEKSKYVFLFTIAESQSHEGKTSLVFAEAYDNIEDMIAAGWAID